MARLVRRMEGVLVAKKPLTESAGGILDSDDENLFDGTDAIDLWGIQETGPQDLEALVKDPNTGEYERVAFAAKDIEGRIAEGTRVEVTEVVERDAKGLRTGFKVRVIA